MNLTTFNHFFPTFN